jgi:hypothetical protein
MSKERPKSPKLPVMRPRFDNETLTRASVEAIRNKAASARKELPARERPRPADVPSPKPKRR